MSKVKARSSYEVYGFMRDELGLSGEKLIAYAVIHGFTMWTGAMMSNFELLADWLECDEEHAADVVFELIDMGLCDAYEVNNKFAIVAKITRDEF